MRRLWKYVEDLKKTEPKNYNQKFNSSQMMKITFVSIQITSTDIVLH